MIFLLIIDFRKVTPAFVYKVTYNLKSKNYLNPAI